MRVRQKPDGQAATARRDLYATDEDALIAARGFTAGIKAFWEDRLGRRLLGLYHIGSLSHGGFNRRYSDIDMALVADGGLTDADLDDMRTEAAALSADLAPRLSLFWSDRSFSVGRFPPLDRADYLDHAEPLVEHECVQPERPSLQEVRTYLRGAPFKTWAGRAEKFTALERLEAADHKPYLRAHLYPARFVYSWMTGRMDSNDAAVAFLQGNAPVGFDVELVARALQCRHAAADPDDLFAARDQLPRQVEACARLL